MHFYVSMKKEYVVLIPKKGQCVKNCRSVSSQFVAKFSNISSIIQSGFKNGDSCANQLLPIAHEIFSSFDYN